MALPSTSEVPTTPPSHGSTSGGHMASYGVYAKKTLRFVSPPPAPTHNSPLRSKRPYPLTTSTLSRVEVARGPRAWRRRYRRPALSSSPL